MKRLKLTNKKAMFGLVGAATAATLFSSSVMAWGPERQLYTMDNPADHPTFNSIKDNNAYASADGIDNFAIGDERQFVKIGEITSNGTVLKDETTVRAGHQYLVLVYFHNDASSSLNKSKVGFALNTKMSSAFDKVIKPGERGEVSATITSSTTTPAAVWDEAYLTSTERVMLRYVEGSAKIFNNNYKTNGSTLSDELFTEDGTIMGLTGWNGIIPGCEEYHGVVTYVLQADKLDGTIEKEVSVNGGKFGENVDIKSGDEVDFKITVKNTGDLPLQYVNIKDELPDGLELVPGSVTFNSLESTSPESLPDWNASGYNLERIGVNNGIVINYKAKAFIVYPQGLPSDECRKEFIDELTNTATLTYGSDVPEGDVRTDTATVTVKYLMDLCKKDDPEPEPKPEDPKPEEPKPEEPKPEDPKPEKTCKTNPEMAGCQKLPNTGPVEITVAIVIVLGIIGAFFYFYRTKKMLKNVSSSVAGPMNNDQDSKDNNK